MTICNRDEIYNNNKYYHIFDDVVATAATEVMFSNCTRTYPPPCRVTIRR